MDETGHSGDAGTAESGAGADSRDRALLNGWSRPDGPWSNAGSALDPEEEENDVPAWRRPGQEIRPFTRQNYPPERPSGEIRPFSESPSGEVRPFGSSSRFSSGDVRTTNPNPYTSGEVRPSNEYSSGELRSNAYSSGEVASSGYSSGEVSSPNPYSSGEDSSPNPYSSEEISSSSLSSSGEIDRPEPAPTPQSPVLLPRWPDGRSRYADLIDHLSPNGNQPAGAPPVTPRPDSLQDDRRPPLSPLDAPPPSSAPPYPYEGDLDDASRRVTPPQVGQQRAAVPLERPTRPVFPAVRPATPGGRRVDWNTTESARHALEPNTPPDGPSRVDQPDAAGEAARVRSSYDPVTFPRRLPNDPGPSAGSAPPADTTTGYAEPTTYSGFTGRSVGDPGATPIGEQISRALPQRVPAEPDVPTVPEPPPVEPSAETPALARIATHLRRGDVLSADERQEGFDVQAILAAVREVEGVRDASLRSTPAGAHSLRLDLSEGADPAEVSRHVARLLQDRMGLDAAMQGSEAAPPPPGLVSSPPVSSPPVISPPITSFVPTQAGPTGRAPVVSSGTVAPPGDDLRQMPTAPHTGRAPVPVPPDDPPAEAPVSPAAAIFPASAPPLIAPVAANPSPDMPGAVAAGPTGTVETVSTGVDCSPPRPLEVGERPGPRVTIENVQVNTFGTEATVEVRLAVGGRAAAGLSTGPAVDGYLLRLCAMATAQAVDELLSGSDHADGPARCFVEHAAAVPFGPMQVAVVVLLLSVGGWVEQLSGSAVVTGDDRHAMVRATLAAVNRRLEALLS